MFINAMHSMVLAAVVQTVINDTQQERVVAAVGREIDMDVVQQVAMNRVQEAVNHIMYHVEQGMEINATDGMATCGMTGWMDGFLIGARWARLSRGVPR